MVWSWQFLYFVFSGILDRLHGVHGIFPYKSSLLNYRKVQWEYCLLIRCWKFWIHCLISIFFFYRKGKVNPHLHIGNTYWMVLKLWKSVYRTKWKVCIFKMEELDPPTIQVATRGTRVCVFNMLLWQNDSWLYLKNILNVKTI